MKILAALLAPALMSLVPLSAGAAPSPVNDAVNALAPDLFALYKDLHQHPELSGHEAATAARMADRLKALGFTLTTGVAGHGVVGVLRNGAGKTLMLRTDLDALPVEEATGAPYASKATAVNETGQTVHLMHACGHDLHMVSWLGAATLLANKKERWRGTLVMVGQPSEETGGGAEGMLKAGLFQRFPKPDYILALHDSAELPAGKVGYTPGFALANVDSVDVTIFGKGGHGAYPHTTVDPIVIAARVVLGLQTLISREKNPLDPGVITVGSIHGGAKHNVIPDEVKLQLTVRSYEEAVRRQLLAGIGRVVRAEAMAAGAPKGPVVKQVEGTPATYNDPALSERVARALRRALGEEGVVKMPPVMGGEDFSYYGRAGVPALIYWVGAVPPDKYAAARRGGQALPSLHSPLFLPDYDPAIRTAVTSLFSASLELLGRGEIPTLR